MALENFVEMCSRVADPDFQKMKGTDNTQRTHNKYLFRSIYLPTPLNEKKYPVKRNKRIGLAIEEIIEKKCPEVTYLTQEMRKKKKKRKKRERERRERREEREKREREKRERREREDEEEREKWERKRREKTKS